MVTLDSSYGRELSKRDEWHRGYVTQVLARVAPLVRYWLVPKGERRSDYLAWQRDIGDAIASGVLAVRVERGPAATSWEHTATWAALGFAGQSELRERYGQGSDSRAWRHFLVTRGYMKRGEDKLGPVHHFLKPWAVLGWLRARGDTVNANHFAAILRTLETPLPSGTAAGLKTLSRDLSGVKRSDADSFAVAVGHVVEVFWRDWDPDTNPPTAAEIVAYLRTKCGVSSDKLAKEIQVAARPEAAKNRGAPKGTREA